ncbi:MAG TPA: serine hydrolase domain-containing protein [Microbacterium sp.]|nr:serine hydrolase domain-containing protein [Microbacterium sp.]
MGLYPLYSVGKSLTAMAVIALGIDPASSLGDLADVPVPFRRMRLLDVLRHRAGLPDYGGWPEYRSAIADPHPWSYEELMDRAARATAPRVGDFHYSNVGYAIVRRIVEGRTERDFHGAIAAALLDPLGIEETAPFAQLEDWDVCVRTVPDVTWYHPGWVLTGTIASSPAAAEAVFAGVLAGELLDPSALLDAVPVDAPGFALPQPGYALGLMTSGAPTPQWVGHGGGGPGYANFVLAAADGSAASAVFCAGVVDQNELVRRCMEDLDDH